MTINLSTTDITITLLCILIMLLASIYGDSSKKTAWMFFLYPIGLIGLISYWIIILIL